jgi:hypothetical protein
MASELLPTWAVRHALRRSLDDSDDAKAVEEIISDERIKGALLVYFVNALMNSRLKLKTAIAQHMLEINLVQGGRSVSNPVLSVNQFTYDRLQEHGQGCGDAVMRIAKLLDVSNFAAVKKELLMIRC